MSAPAIKHTTAPAPLDVLDCFIERAEARAYLWSIGEFTLHEAVDKLQTDAVRDGLVDRVGQDAVQQIIAFALFYQSDTEASL
jgi:hypothetical protein